MRLTMMRSGEIPELFILTDDDRHVRVADLLKAADTVPFRVYDPEHPALTDIFRSGDVSTNLTWLEQRAATALEASVDGWSWAVPDTGGSLYCVGRNYAAHAAELGNKVPGKPMFFMKSRGCLAANQATVTRPPSSDRVDYEGELALIIGEPLRGPIDDLQARKSIVAVTLLNDISDRAEQNKAKEAGKPWFRAKARIGFAPMGPWLRTVSESRDLREFTYQTLLNGTVVQDGDPSLWLWDAVTVVRDLSETSGLEAGDIIATGTPAGVGPMQVGDVVAVTSSEIGTLRTLIG
ncbi:fumarylacetoacetate hydrolase family protein [bacterium]|nr:fumarylacetoacetate hydrolase family protein [bacterium]